MRNTPFSETNTSLPRVSNSVIGTTTEPTLRTDSPLPFTLPRIELPDQRKTQIMGTSVENNGKLMTVEKKSKHTRTSTVMNPELYKDLDDIDLMEISSVYQAALKATIITTIHGYWTRPERFVDLRNPVYRRMANEVVRHGHRYRYVRIPALENNQASDSEKSARPETPKWRLEKEADVAMAAAGLPPRNWRS
ncbi:hypothetical protein E1B28_002871 [Marasmius oreades]|uniref:Uncharacterized protein n=1 Tax=Marasmius oreades TaxID=181124 RepID=A0A9P7RNJ5_9AGAR|nr:uncharacterized protein E1B28_002871 [Marasmius oreades]KAG7086954.1 hypothetical protein E1B28_002871 [Marasmius oreades]